MTHDDDGDEALGLSSEEAELLLDAIDANQPDIKAWFATFDPVSADRIFAVVQDRESLAKKFVELFKGKSLAEILIDHERRIQALERKFS